MNNNTIQNLQKRQTEAKYAEGRRSLLFLVIFSLINLISIPLLDMYFLFSAYLPSLFSSVGIALYQESGEMLYIVILSIIGVISLLPYAACWLFSKKHIGWMIGALAVFSIETLFVAFDAILYLIEGDIYMLLDLVFHIYVLVCLINGVRFGLKAKKIQEEEPILTQGVPANEEGKTAFVRDLTVTRPKAFVGVAIRLTVLIDGVPVGSIGNNETLSFKLPEKSVVLSFATPDNTNISSDTVPEGTAAESYNVSFKMTMTETKIVIERTTPTPAANTGTVFH